MRGRYQCLIVAIILTCSIILVIPVSGLQSSEQTLSDSLTRGSRFTITITGLPNTPYYVWLTGTSTMTGKQYDQPPVISNTANIEKDPEDGPYTIGTYQYNNGGGRTILDDVAPSSTDMSNTSYYAKATTDERGQIIVEFRTSVYTGLRSYSVKVENPSAPESENFRVEQTIYSRTAGPMINTPATTVYVPTSTTVVTPVPTTAIPITTETQLVTIIPSTTAAPRTTQKTPLIGESILSAMGVCLVVLVLRRERQRG